MRVQQRGLTHDIHLGFVYIPPNGPKERDPLGPLREGLARVPSGQPCYVMGDLNARVGNCTTHTEVAPFRYVNGIMEEDEEVGHPPQRWLRDQTMNVYGRELLRLAAMSDMIIVNGTDKDASQGAYTCYSQPTSPSVIDLVLVSQQASYTIQEMNTLSHLPDITDHCAVTVSTLLTTEAANQEVQQRGDMKKVTFQRPKWTQDNKASVTQDLSTPDTKARCHVALRQTDLTTKSSEQAYDGVVKDINHIIMGAIENNCQVRRQQIPPPDRGLTNQADSTDQPWFDETCDRAKRDMRELAEACHRQNRPLPPRYFGLRTQYKRIIARTQARYKQTIRDKMAEKRHKEPRTWWALLRQLNDTRQVKTMSQKVQPQQWLHHFRTLLNTTDRPQLPPPPPSPTHTAAPPPATTKEIIQMYRSNSKYNGPINTGEWCKSYLKPLYKKGPIDDPANYRGIAISSWRRMESAMTCR